MDRLACVDVPALPLQLLLRRHPDWAAWPVVVVDEDKPQGLILWANEAARRAGILPGWRYGPGLALVPTLRAGTVDETAVREGVRELGDRLLGHSPMVEPSAKERGVFWLDAGGLEGLYPSLEAWAGGVRQDLAELGYVAAVVAGYRRFGVYAAAKWLRGRKAAVFKSRDEEDRIARRVPLDLVDLAPAARDALAKLGVTRVGDFLELPSQGILQRFGPEAHALHLLASGRYERPLNPLRPETPLEAHLEIGYREDGAERLVFMVKPLVDHLLSELGHRGLALAELRLRLLLDDAPAWEERIRTAEPTLASVTVMELVQLRLAAKPLAAPAVEIVVEVGAAEPATDEQLAFFAEAPRRDLAAAARAFARLRAAFGEDVVVKAAVRDRHLPEASFGWEPLARPVPARPLQGRAGALVRRILARPERLPTPPGGGEWSVLGRNVGTVVAMSGPYRLGGGWWHVEVRRDYYFAETSQGDLLWIYYDALQRRWYVQGEIA